MKNYKNALERYFRDQIERGVSTEEKLRESLAQLPDTSEVQRLGATFRKYFGHGYPEAKLHYDVLKSLGVRVERREHLENEEEKQ